jgi:hypothetical protein
MSESSSLEVNGGRLQDFTIDQMAGATALVLGSIGGLLMIIWKSRCACRMRIGCSDKCYIFDCSREPPPLEEDSDEEDKKKKKDKKQKPPAQPEPEPEPEIEDNP